VEFNLENIGGRLTAPSFALLRSPDHQSMPEPKKLECFVVMPFGKKPLPNGSSCDFDAIYRTIISPAVKAAGMSPQRDDEKVGSHLIHSEMFRKLRDKPVVLADLSTANPNVFYELGLRHVMSPRGTVLICRTGVAIPFDVALLRVAGYSFKGARPTQKEAEAAASIIAAALREAVDQVNSPVHRFLPRVLRRTDFDYHRGTAARADTDPLVRYPRLLAAAWREKGDEIASLLREHTSSAFGVRALGYYCLDGADHPSIALKVAWELSSAEEYDLAIRLYSKLKEAGSVIGKDLLRMASTYHDAHSDEQGIKVAMGYVREALQAPRADGPSSDGRPTTGEEIKALGQSRLGSLFQNRWELKGEDQYLQKAIKAYATARKLMEKARSNGNFLYPGMIAHTLLKLLVLNRLEDRGVTNPGGVRDAILGISQAREDDPVSISFLHWAQAIVLADMGKEHEATEKVAKRLDDDGKLTGVYGGLEIGGRQYSTLLRFLERYEDAFLNPSTIEHIAQQLSRRIRSM
jgi:tetratricopeptide (TPR) repeat protein